MASCQSTETLGLELPHTASTVHLLLTVLGMIKRTIRYKDTRVMMSLYKTLVRPHIEYCVSAWNLHYIKDKKRTFTKISNNMEGKTYEERLQCLKLWTLEKRRNRQDLIEVFMVALWNRADDYIFILFLLSSSSFFARLISAVGNWMFTILWHMVWP